jgi:hypothetical protein
MTKRNSKGTYIGKCSLMFRANQQSWDISANQCLQREIQKPNLIQSAALARHFSHLVPSFRHSFLPSRLLPSYLPRANGETRRWNGQYRLPKCKESNFAVVKDKLGVFIDWDLDAVEAITEFLSTVYFLTKKLECDKYSTVQHIFPSFCKLEREIKKCTMPKFKPFVDAAWDAFETRFAFI